MSSSRTSASHPGSTHRARLLELLATVPDPRDPRGIRHPAGMLLAVGIAAVLAGSRSYAAIGEWVIDQPSGALEDLGVFDGSRPEKSCLRRLFARVDADALDQVLGAWMFTRTAVLDGRRVIAIDSKTVRGARTAGASAPHLVAALDHTTGTVLGQLAVAAKSNEIPAVRDLLANFDLTGVVITVDAMHTQTDTAQVITAGGGEYVFTIKGNQPRLHTACKKLPWKDVPAHRVTTTGHGRAVTRTIKVIDAPAWITFPGATQLAQVRRTVTKAGKKTIEVVYLLTSAGPDAAPPATLAAWVQGHWGIENRLHWCRDVTFDDYAAFGIMPTGGRDRLACLVWRSRWSA